MRGYVIARSPAIRRDDVAIFLLFIDIINVKDCFVPLKSGTRNDNIGTFSTGPQAGIQWLQHKNLDARLRGHDKNGHVLGQPLLVRQHHSRRRLQFMKPTVPAGYRLSTFPP
jgi:hypothetical protein